MPQKHIMLISSTADSTVNKSFFEAYVKLNSLSGNLKTEKKINDVNYTLNFSLTSDVIKPTNDVNFIIFYPTSDLTSLRNAKNLGLAIRRACGSNAPITMVGLRDEVLEDQQTISYEEGMIAASKIHGNISFTECSLDKIEEINAVIETSITGMPPDVMRDYVSHIDFRLSQVEKLNLTAEQEDLINFILKALKKVSYEDKASQYFLMVIVTKLWTLKATVEEENKELVDAVLRMVKKTIMKYCGSQREIDAFAAQLKKKEEQLLFKSFFSDENANDQIKKSSPLSRSMSQILGNKQTAEQRFGTEIMSNIMKAITESATLASPVIDKRKWN